MAWCLIKQFADAFRLALKDGTIDPVKLSQMTSAERNSFLAKYVGEENATNVNSLFESKLLLKNQQLGMISWAKRVAGMTPQIRSDIVTRIERMSKILDPQEGEQFLHDLASTKLKMEVTQEEAKNIADLSKAVTTAKSLADKNGVFPSEENRLEYGASKVALEEYVNELKLESRKITFKEDPLKKVSTLALDIPSASKSLLSSMDNSFWGRQGLPVLLNTRTAGIWTRNFMKSWSDIGTELAGKDAMAIVKADIYSRPNAVNGKYKAGGYGLDVLSEEAFPSTIPEKIPLLRRLYRASTSAYNGAALRLRADLADRYIAIAEKQGINTLNPDDAKPIGRMIGSMTGRGSLGKAEVIAKEANILFFSIKYLKSNVDKVTAPINWLAGETGIKPFKSAGEKFARVEAAKNTLNMAMTAASLITIAGLLNPDWVDDDPRSTNFGKVKIFGHWVDITGGMASLVTLASRLIPTKHEGERAFWYKSSSGNWFKLEPEGYMSAWDVITGFLEGKLAPAASVLADIWKGEDFNGEPVTLSKAVKGATIPLPLQNMKEIIEDPASGFVLGSIILDLLGFSTSTSITPNKNSQIIPENTKVTDGDIISYVMVYSKALDVDPVTAFNRIFTGQKIVRVTGNTVIVERMPVSESQEIKKKANADNPEMKLDHTIPLELGGTNDENNLKLVSTSKWRSFTPVENALGKALKEGKVTKKEAQDLIIKFKNGDMTKDQITKAIDGKKY